MKSGNEGMEDIVLEEEVQCRNGYFSGYTHPEHISIQIDQIKKLFIDIGHADLEVAKRPLPEGAEGYFAIPRWEVLEDNYCSAVNMIFDVLKTVRDGKFFNYRRGRLTSDVLRQHERTVKAFKVLQDEQPGCDILIVPAQFGLRHAGRSMRRARSLFLSNEFGLGAFHVAAMLITHPRRMAQYSDLWADCVGDEYNDLSHAENYGRATRFIFDGGQEEFGTNWIKYPEYSDGSVSGFLCSQYSL